MESVAHLQVLAAWLFVSLPFILFGIAAIKWGVYTTGDHGKHVGLKF